MSNPCLQLKGSVVTTFILELYRYSVEEFTQQLTDKINQAPGFFDRSPLVISLDKLEESIQNIDLVELVSICRQQNLQPMAFRSEDVRFAADIEKTGLVHLSNSAIRSKMSAGASADTQSDAIELTQSASGSTATDSSDEKTAAENNPQIKAEPKPSKIISRPVRSGQQVYAEGSDLIILSHVSEGAEVLADGNIHVYGTLRGRALAGVKGDIGARVFCKNLQAELVSIAGNFMMSDALRAKLWEASAQIYLDGQTLHVEAV